MHNYDAYEVEIPVTRPESGPEDDEQTLDAPRGRRQEDGGEAGGRSPRARGGYTILLPGLRDLDWER